MLCGLECLRGLIFSGLEVVDLCLLWGLGLDGLDASNTSLFEAQLFSIGKVAVIAFPKYWADCNAAHAKKILQQQPCVDGIIGPHSGSYKSAMDSNGSNVGFHASIYPATKGKNISGFFGVR